MYAIFEPLQFHEVGQ